MECVFPAAVESVPEALSAVASEAEAMGVGPEDRLRLALAVEEDLTNVCRHAYTGHSGQMWLRTGRRNHRFRVRLADAGAPFDPLASPDPDTSLALEARQPGGLGLMLLRHVGVDVRYCREAPHNIVTLSVAVTGPDGEQGGAGRPTDMHQAGTS